MGHITAMVCPIVYTSQVKSMINGDDGLREWHGVQYGQPVH